MCKWLLVIEIEKNKDNSTTIMSLRIIIMIDPVDYVIVCQFDSLTGCLAGHVARTCYHKCQSSINVLNTEMCKGVQQLYRMSLRFHKTVLLAIIVLNLIRCQFERLGS